VKAAQQILKFISKRSYKTQGPALNQPHGMGSKYSSQDTYKHAGFRRGTGTRNQIGMLRIMSE
jgi:hypothetical protein